ncbi:ORF035R [Rock bream iridovirus]|uniref:ORF035R n=1 Tax=Rock bream iridovirus TaxID=263891 RepID=Q5YF52_ISKNV|nr:ORF035R [Rock bream iridovirus]
MFMCIQNNVSTKICHHRQPDASQVQALHRAPTGREHLHHRIGHHYCRQPGTCAASAK